MGNCFHTERKDDRKRNTIWYMETEEGNTVPGCSTGTVSVEQTSTVLVEQTGTVSDGVPVDPPDVVVEVEKSPVTTLNDFSTKHNIPVVYYVVPRAGVHTYSHSPTYAIQARCGMNYGYGTGPSKREAKRNAANDLLKYIVQR